ncbi:MAG: phosphotransferase family protein [Proteobacteria bacterium]|nr:phosphotransferase family protein [Pseudomonadota bacterium]MBU4010323.1 phosphotransferase family protein [Pseudomonadota bacterium]MBU4035326.1 phosphotransferase family protein [Pseudomonadota bacterium]
MSKEMDIENIRGRLKEWFKSKIPQASQISLSPLKKPVSGLSNQTFFFELSWWQAGEMRVENLVLRCAPTGFLMFPKYDMKEQFILMKNLENTAVPVPRSRWLEEDESVIGVPFYIVDQVQGWIPGDHPPYHVAGPLYEATPEEKARIWWKAVDIMAKIHTLDLGEVDLGFLGVPKGGTDPIDQEIAYYDKMLKMNEEPPPPILERTRNWLKENIFEPKHVSLCWGDARLANLMYQSDEVVAVLDWEMAFLGDPESDLGWFIHMDWATSEGLQTKPSPRLAGLPGTQETLAHYERITNRKVENFFYHEVFATWRMAVVYTRLAKHQRFISNFTKIDITRSHFDKLTRLLSL